MSAAWRRLVTAMLPHCYHSVVRRCAQDAMVFMIAPHITINPFDASEVARLLTAMTPEIHAEGIRGLTALDAQGIGYCIALFGHDYVLGNKRWEHGSGCERPCGEVSDTPLRSSYTFDYTANGVLELLRAARAEVWVDSDRLFRCDDANDTGIELFGFRFFVDRTRSNKEERTVFTLSDASDN